MLPGSHEIEPPEDPLVGTELNGRYRLERLVATGGMGSIFEGVHLELGRPVAVKVLSEAFTQNHEAVKRFQREARASSRIDHPAIVDVLDLGRLPTGEPYLVMELLEGSDVSDLIARESPMPVGRVVELLRPIASALDIVHAQGILHRDIKPANIFVALGQDGVQRSKLLDFGLAALRDMSPDDKLTRAGVVVGTPHYVSPEAAEGDEIDHRTDIYSLGVVVFEMLTNTLPVDSDRPMTLLTEKVRKPAPSLSDRSGRSFDPELERVVARALSRTPAKRPATATELIDQLEAVASGSATASGGGAPKDGKDRSASATAATMAGSTGPEIAELGQSEPKGESTGHTKPDPSVAAEPSVAVMSQDAVPTDPPDAPADSTLSDSSAPAPLPVPDDRPKIIAVIVVAVLACAAIIWWRWGPRGDDVPPSTPDPAAEVASTGEVASDPPPEPTAILSEPEPEAAPELAPEPELEAEPAAGTPPAARNPRPWARRTPARASTETPPAPAPEAQPTPAPSPPPPAEGPDSERARLLAVRGARALVRGEMAQARAAYRQATYADSSLASAWRGLGLSSEHLQMRGEAVEAYRRYLALDPNARDAAHVRERISRLSR